MEKIKKSKNKHLNKLNFNLDKLLSIYFGEIPFYVRLNLKRKVNDLLTQDLYLVLKNLDLFDFYLEDKGYSKRNNNFFNLF